MGQWRRRLSLLVAYFLGSLVFLIGVSVLFESILLGLLLVLGSSVVIPATRSRITDTIPVPAPTALAAVIVLGSLAAPSLVFTASYETGSYFGTSEDVTVKVTYDDDWAGEISAANHFRRITGDGPRTIAVSSNHGTVEAFAEKQNGSGGELTIAIRIGNETVATETAGEGDNRASVSFHIGLFEN